MTVDDFRAAYPEFEDATKYPDAMIQRFLDLAVKMLPACVWGDSLDLGIGLFVAHNVVLSARAMAAASAGGSGVGSVSGPISSKTVDKVSVAYDIKAVTVENGAFWNTTSYGVQLLYWARLFGTMAIQL